MDKNTYTFKGTCVRCKCRISWIPIRDVNNNIDNAVVICMAKPCLLYADDVVVVRGLLNKTK